MPRSDAAAARVVGDGGADDRNVPKFVMPPRSNWRWRSRSPSECQVEDAATDPPKLFSMVESVTVRLPLFKMPPAESWAGGA